MGHSILITGASGMLGRAIALQAIREKRQVVASSRANQFELPLPNFHECDLLDLDACVRLVRLVKPELLIHCAAITGHAVCEANETLARRVHVDASKILAREQAQICGRFIHISSEAVYGSAYSQNRPHREVDRTRPKGIYAITKEEGERAVLKAHPGALVLRVTPVGLRPGFSGNSLAEWIVRRLVNSYSVGGYTNAFFSPISMAQVANFVLCPDVASLEGIYNLCGSSVVTKYQFAFNLARALDYNDDLVTRTMVDTEGGKYEAGLSCDKLEHDLSQWHAPDFEAVIDSLKSYVVNSKR